MADAELFHDVFHLRSTRDLVEVCTRLREEFSLPAFELDFENQSERGVAASAATRVQVSRAYAPNALHDWSPDRPPGSNYSVQVTVLVGAPGVWNEAARAAWRENWLTTLAELADGAVQG